MVSVACANTSTPTPNPIPSATLETPSNWWISWLSRPVCSPPCWQNITPGITTFDEAAATLQQTPGITITFKSKIGLDWEFSKDEGGVLHADQAGTVQFFWLASVSDNKLSVKSIVAVYDEPDYVKPYDCGGEVTMCSIALIYPDLGMCIHIYKENKGGDAESPHFEVSATDDINRVYFFESGLENFPNLYTLRENEVPLHWKGFGEYP
jgi:hypothetical protein